MGFFNQLRGIMGSLFQIGGTSGPNIVNNSGEVDFKNSGNTAYAPVGHSTALIADVATLPATPTAGAALYSLTGGLLGFKDEYARQTALTELNQSLVNNYSNSLTSFTPLAFSLPMQANEVWQVEYYLFTTCAGTGGLEFEFTGPTGATIIGQLQGELSISSPVNVPISAFNTPTTAVNTTTGTQLMQRIVVTVTNGSTAGNLVLNVKTVTSGNAATVAAGSAMNASLSLPPSALPLVTSVSPNVADTSGGGGLITITGSNFTGVTAVSLGGTAVTSFTFVNDSIITCTPAAHAAGSGLNVQVTNATGPNTANTLFTYWTPAQITGYDGYWDSGKGVTTSGSNVTAWTDQGAHAIVASGSSGSYPTVSSNAFSSSINGIAFNGSQFLSLTERVLASGLSFFFVGKWTSTTSTPTSPGSANVALTVIHNAITGWDGFGAAAGQISYNSYNSGGSSQTIFNQGSGNNDGNPHITGVTHDTSGNIKSYQNAAQQGTTQTQTYSTTEMGYDTIGCGSSNPTDAFVGTLGAVITVSGIISGSDLTLLSTWAQQRFGTI